jgi:hypothetical protein
VAIIKLTKEEQAMVERALRLTPLDRGVNEAAVSLAITRLGWGLNPMNVDYDYIKRNARRFLNFTDADADATTVNGVPRWHFLIGNVGKHGPDGGSKPSPLNACTLEILKWHKVSGAGGPYFEVLETNLMQRKFAPYLELLRRSGYTYEAYSTAASLRVMEQVRRDLSALGPMPINVLAMAIAEDQGLTRDEVIFILGQSEGQRGGVRFHGGRVSLVQRVSPTRPEPTYGFVPKLGNRKTVRG